LGRHQDHFQDFKKTQSKSVLLKQYQQMLQEGRAKAKVFADYLLSLKETDFMTEWKMFTKEELVAIERSSD